MEGLRDHRGSGLPGGDLRPAGAVERVVVHTRRRRPRRHRPVYASLLVRFRRQPAVGRGMPVESPDLSTYLCLHMEALAGMAEALGETEDAARFRARADDLVPRMIEHFYDPQAGVFWAMRPTDEGHRRVEVLTSLNLFPLWTGRLPPADTQRLADHLTTPGAFLPIFPNPHWAHSATPLYPPQTCKGA